MNIEERYQAAYLAANKEPCTLNKVSDTEWTISCGPDDLTATVRYTATKLTELAKRLERQVSGARQKSRRR